MRVLLTGACGFIGMHVAMALLDRGDEVLGVDNLNDYYDVDLKRARLEELRKYDSFEWQRRMAGNVGSEIVGCTGTGVYGCDAVIHLAALAGVRASTERPLDYLENNVAEWVRLLEAVRLHCPEIPVVWASSSSVKTVASIYGATKAACESMAEAYASLHGLRLTGLRYHTVYGPWGRPDMALWKFTRQALAGEPIEIYNHGVMERDFTYIDDVVQATIAALDRPGEPGSSRVYSIGSGRTVPISRLVNILAYAVGKSIEVQMAPMQLGDVASSLADLTDARRDLGYAPAWSVEEGVPRFVDWYRGYHG